MRSIEEIEARLFPETSMFKLTSIPGAGHFLFNMVSFVLLFLLLCCCCCRRRVKKSTGSSLGVSQSSTSNSSSQGGACGPEVERHGSIVGFADSSQKLLPSSSSPMQRGGPHHHQRYAKAFASASITSPELKSSASQSSRFYGMVGSGSRDETTLDYRGITDF